MLASRFYLEEKISLSRWVGVGLIVAGIINNRHCIDSVRCDTSDTPENLTQ